MSTQVRDRGFHKPKLNNKPCSRRSWRFDTSNTKAPRTARSRISSPARNQVFRPSNPHAVSLQTDISRPLLFNCFIKDSFLRNVDLDNLRSLRSPICWSLRILNSVADVVLLKSLQLLYFLFSISIRKFICSGHYYSLLASKHGGIVVWRRTTAIAAYLYVWFRWIIAEDIK